MNTISNKKILIAYCVIYCSDDVHIKIVSELAFVSIFNEISELQTFGTLTCVKCFKKRQRKTVKPKSFLAIQKQKIKTLITKL